MLGDPQIGLKPLAALCRRLAISLGSGVDVRTVWVREAKSAQGAGRRRMEAIALQVSSGATISDGLKKTGNYFPEFFRELIHVGEETGHLPEVCRKLSEHYEHQLKLRRTLLSSITWPLIELALALGVVGVLIYLMGVIPQLKGTDMLGFGLSGASGLITYLMILAAIAAGGLFLYRAVSRGALWAAPVQRAVMKTPQLGRALETLAIARLSWAMHVTLNSGMELRQAIKLSLRSTHNAAYTQHIAAVVRDISAGREIHEALARTKAFPLGFVDVVAVGEESGQLVEAMGNLSGQYQDESRLAMNTLSVLLGVAISALIGAIIIFFIYQIFTRAYLGPINDALKPGR